MAIASNSRNNRRPLEGKPAALSQKRKPAFATLQWAGKSPAEPRAASLRQTSLVLPTGNSDANPPNRLIHGDNLGVMAALLSEFEGSVDLIYADPPFLSGKSYRARTGRGEDSRRPAGWKTTEGFEDSWPGLSEYLNMLYPRLELMYRLLSETGTLYLHLDWHAAAYGRVVLDEIFGPDRLLNEIIWVYHGPSPIRTAFKRKHDTIYAYTKSKAYTFNSEAVRVPYDPATAKAFESSPKAGFGKRPDLARGKVPEDWWYFPVVARLHSERTGYPTQKPEALLERIIVASSRAGELVADFFCGAGTTVVVADRFERRWIACDLSPLAIGASRRRLLLQPAARPFSVWEDTATALEPSLQPRVRVSIASRQAQARLMDLSRADLESLTGLEVDWDYDGKLFRSQAQSVRGWRSAEFPTALANTYLEPGGYTVAARVMAARGEFGLSTERIRLR